MKGLYDVQGYFDDMFMKVLRFLSRKVIQQYLPVRSVSTCSIETGNAMRAGCHPREPPRIWDLTKGF